MRLIFFFLVVVWIMPIFAPFDPMKTAPEMMNQPPDHVHLLGTDMLGRDVFSRLLHGGTRTVMTAAAATLIALIPGTLMGLTAGFYGGRWEQTVLIVNNALLAFPGILLAFVVLASFGQSIALAVGIAQSAATVQVARSAAIAVRSMAYIEAAEAAGASNFHILRYYVLPNCLPVLRAYALVLFSYSILNSAALSFLGFAGQPGIPDWGVMLAEGRSVFREAPWVSFAPGAAITLMMFLTGFALNRSTSRTGLR